MYEHDIDSHAYSGQSMDEKTNVDSCQIDYNEPYKWFYIFLVIDWPFPSVESHFTFKSSDSYQNVIFLKKKESL